MAKKQASAEAEQKKAPAKEKAETKEPKKPREPKAKEEKPKEDKAKEPKGKEPKGKEGKARESKGKPAAPSEPPSAPSEAPATAPTAPAAPPAPGEPTKKRGKAPGAPPPRGKKLRAHLVNLAKEAGADHVGSDELIKKIQGGWLDFDVALATQDMMGQVSRLGKTLGPRGLMPTPKAGTVITGDISAGVKEFKAGKVEYRADKGGNIHAGVGKLSFDDNKLFDNITVFVDQVRAAKPSGVKGNYVKSITLSATMSPGIAVSM